jgi:restriction endonuclease Mrr
MARRRKNDDLFWAEAVGGMATVLVGLSILIPGFRVLVIGTIMIVFVLGMILVVAFVAYKIATSKRASNSNCTSAYSAWQAAAASASAAKNPNSRPMPYVVPSECDPYVKTEINPIDRLREIDWFQFERFVAYIYEKRGYNVTRKGGANPDGGIDLVIEKDRQIFAVQCKQWKAWNVGVNGPC